LTATAASIVDERLENYCGFGQSCPARLAEAIRYCLLAPGKRLRPRLVLLAARTCGNSNVADALPAACAVEMIHAYSLIHDDLPAMDDDDMRRGRPSCHVAFDEATAILAGDALLTLAFEVLATDIQPGATAARCCGELARAAGVAGMVGGQADDLAAERLRGSADQLESIHLRKTGALLRVSLRLGGIVAGANDEQLETLDQFGIRLGLAFQIVDDLLDASGKESDVGKRTGKDATRGKLTFPRLLGLEESRQRAEQLIAEACDVLEPFGPEGEDLRRVARFVLGRNR
jgi:geranylgeranyl diphosphate synthase type II